MKIEGVALRVPGDDVDTDGMYPGAFLNIEDPAKMAPHLFEGFDPSLRERLTEDTILVVGANFGIGSSREHVPLAMKANGIRGLVGRSFARIFYRNCVNLGLPIVACPEAVDMARDGAKIAFLETRRLVIDGVSFPVPDQAPLISAIGRAGGLVEWTAAQLAWIDVPRQQPQAKRRR